MKMSKKITMLLLLILVLVFVQLLTACGLKEKSGNQDQAKASGSFAAALNQQDGSHSSVEDEATSAKALLGDTEQPMNSEDSGESKGADSNREEQRLTDKKEALGEETEQKGQADSTGITGITGIAGSVDRTEGTESKVSLESVVGAEGVKSVKSEESENAMDSVNNNKVLKDNKENTDGMERTKQIGAKEATESDGVQPAKQSGIARGTESEGGTAKQEGKSGPTSERTVEVKPTAKSAPKATASGNDGVKKNTGPVRIGWSEFFDGEDQTTPSERFWDLSGQEVTINGFMGEVLSFDENWFLLIPEPGAECPFDNGDETYWNKIMIVFVPDDVKLRYKSEPLQITGRLDVGIKIDESGYKTMFRLYDASFKELKE